MRATDSRYCKVYSEKYVISKVAWYEPKSKMHHKYHLVFFHIKNCNPKISTIPTISGSQVVLNVCYCFHTATLFQKNFKSMPSQYALKSIKLLSRDLNYRKSVIVNYRKCKESLKTVHSSCLS